LGKRVIETALRDITTNASGLKGATGLRANVLQTKTRRGHPGGGG